MNEVNREWIKTLGTNFVTLHECISKQPELATID